MKSIQKALAPEQTVEACKKLKSAAPNLRLAGTFILGGPGESYEEALDIAESSKNFELTFALFYPLEVYPGTRLYQKKFGSDMRSWFNGISHDSVFCGSLIYEDVLKKNELAKLICEAYRIFYRRKEWINLAKQQLGDHLSEILPVVNAWGEASRW